MKNNICGRNRLPVPPAMGIIVLTMMGFDARSTVQVTDRGQMHIDITTQT